MSQTDKRMVDASLYQEEPVKKNIRVVGGDGISSIIVKSNTIQRIPHVLVRPDAPKTEMPDRPQRVIMLRDVEIDQAGRLRSAEHDIRLAGIAAPTIGQTCWGNGNYWPCGITSRTAMRRFVRNRPVTCIVVKRRSSGLTFGSCFVNGIDIAEWMVKRGWAVVADNSPLAPDMRIARQRYKGVWRWGFDAQSVLLKER